MERYARVTVSLRSLRTLRRDRMLNLEQRLRTQLDAFSTRSAVEANSRGDGAIISDAHCSSLPAQQRHENLAQVRTASMVAYSHTGGALQHGQQCCAMHPCTTPSADDRSLPLKWLVVASDDLGSHSMIWVYIRSCGLCARCTTNGRSKSVFFAQMLAAPG